VSGRDVFFWLWLGGALGFSLNQLETSEFRESLRKHQHTVKDANWRFRLLAMGAFYLMALLVMFLWPVTLLVRFVVGSHIRDALNRKLTFVKTRCTVCGFEGEITTPRGNDRWASLPFQWYVNTQMDVVCSPACARHYDHCPPIQANIELH
jgi:hypothetical protein